MQVRTEEEVIEAIKTALGPKNDCLCFIEVIAHKDDTSKELLEWGSRVSAADTLVYANPRKLIVLLHATMERLILSKGMIHYYFIF